jgi:hypothetical protein
MSDWVILGGRVPWAIEAARIRAIVPRAEWTKTTVDPGVLWGAPSPPATRVVVIDDDLAIAAPQLGFRALEGERVVPLPAEWARRDAKNFVQGLIFEDDGHALVVLHVEGLRWQ